MKLNAYRYKIPFATPLKTSKKIFEHREGLILEYRKNNHAFYGEAAPLPGFSKEMLHDVIHNFDKSKSEFRQILNSSSPVRLLKKWERNNECVAALAFGINTLAYQLEAKQDGKKLQEYLFEEAQDQVPVNALLSLSSEDIIQEIHDYQQRGFRTIKFKVGFHFETEYNQLKKVRSQFPELHIRTDANQSWKLDEALRNCKKLGSLNIEYCEEPLIEPSASNFERLYQNVTLPLAIDESVIHGPKWEELLPFTSHIILKPMLLGSFEKIFQTYRKATANDNETIFTTSLECGIGRRITAILASGLGSSKHAHGLNTGNLLTEDITDIENLSKGISHLKDRLNELSVDPQKLKEVSTIIS